MVRRVPKASASQSVSVAPVPLAAVPAELTKSASLPFQLASFLGAFLLFWLEPLVAKLLLPGLGGAAAVWALCLVFFQAALLAGYAYAHLARSTLSLRAQVRLHLAVCALALFTLPIQIDVTSAPAPGVEPTQWLLGRLLLTVAPVFIAAAATTPLVQGWYAQSGRDPYFLYAASNLGSVAALLLFPLWLEPAFDLEGQKHGWSAGFLLLGALMAACAWRVPDAPPSVQTVATPEAWRTRLMWLVLSAVPSALLVGATRYISTDVAALPLLWVLPLALYLLSFVHAFARRPWLKLAHTGVLATCALGLLATFPQLGFGAPSLTTRIGLHCFALFAVSLALHGRLSSLRPASEQSSSFYLWVSLGGVLGGVLTTLVAPMVSVSGLEYPISVAAAAFLLSGRESPPTAADPKPAVVSTKTQAAAIGKAKRRKGTLSSEPPRVETAASARRLFSPKAGATLDWLLPLGLALMLWISQATQWPAALVGWVTLAFVLAGRGHRLRLGAMIAILFVGRNLLSSEENVLHRSRNFFGTLVVRDYTNLRVLMHGTTQHGGQSSSPARRGQPLAYYHPYGPVGRLLMEHEGKALTREVGVVGLGVGSLISYARRGDSWTYYEIDPAVIQVAQDPALFTLIRNAETTPRIVEGDARLSLTREPDGRFSLLILDAFTSDAVPLHLLTREALALCERKLRPDGALMIHISNRNLDLAPILARTAKSLGMTIRRARDDDDRGLGPDDWKLPSEWVFLAPDQESLHWLARLPLWEELTPSAGEPWTDRASNLLEALR